MRKRKLMYGAAIMILVGAFLLYFMPLFMMDKACAQLGCVTMRLVVCNGVGAGGLCNGGGECTAQLGAGWVQLSPLRRFSRWIDTGPYTWYDRSFYVGICMSQ